MTDLQNATELLPLPDFAPAGFVLSHGAHIGIDEAGRGCLAGPVVAAAVLFEPDFDFQTGLPGLTDSKKLAESRRDLLAAKVRAECVACGIGLSWQDEVDSVNIRNATFRAMTRAVFDLAASLRKRAAKAGEANDGELPPLVIDGNALIPVEQWRACCSGPPPGAGQWESLLDFLPDRRHQCLQTMPEQVAVVDGDALVPSVSAASVLAKTERDKIMAGLDGIFPGYGLARHKGYGTREHLKAIGVKGPCALHRKTFRGVRPVPEQLLLF